MREDAVRSTRGEVSPMGAAGAGRRRRDSGAYDLTGRWHRIAAERGCPSGQYHMALMSSVGAGGVAADVREAVRWCKLAADQGHAGALAALGGLVDAKRAKLLEEGAAEGDGRAGSPLTALSYTDADVHAWFHGIVETHHLSSVELEAMARGNKVRNDADDGRACAGAASFSNVDSPFFLRPFVLLRSFVPSILRSGDASSTHSNRPPR
jgi:TPR repeat protein